VLLELGPATVHASTSLELTVIRASQQPEPPTQAAPSVDIGLTHHAWVFSTATAMGTVAQLVAPGNRFASLAGLVVGYVWAEWRWRQQG